MANWDEVIASNELVAKTGSWDFWQEYLTDHPDVLHRILGDLYQVTSGSKERPPTLDDLWEMVTPSYSHEPFGPTMLKLLAGRSQRWLASQTGIPQSQIWRLMAGTKPIVMAQDPIGSMQRLEIFARGVKVHPSHFTEWRRLWAMALIDTAFDAHPNLSISFFKKFSDLPKQRVPTARTSVRTPS